VAEVIFGGGAASVGAYGACAKTCAFGYLEFIIKVCQLGLDARLGGRR